MTTKIKSGEGHIAVKIYGIEARYDVKSKEEEEKTARLIEMLQLQEKHRPLHRPVDANDALRKTYVCGLGEVVVEAFDSAVRKEQIVSIMGLAGSFCIYALARKYNWSPLVEGGAGLCGLANVLLYAKAGLAGFVANQYLRGKQ